MKKEITSDFAILDVKKGRHTLFRYFNECGVKTNPSGIGVIPKAKPVPVIITGYIVDVWGHDDGISREFQIQVTDVEVSKP